MKNNLSCSEITKQKMANGLKELMKTIPFNKITVSDITEQCQIHRQTFYYHFQDKYELLNWLINNELIKTLTSDFCYENMYEKFYDSFNVMYQNKKFYQNAFKINTSILFDYVSKISIDVLDKVIKSIAEKHGIITKAENIDTIAEFFGFGFSGVMMSWANRGMTETPEEMTQKIREFIENFTEIITK